MQKPDELWAEFVEWLRKHTDRWVFRGVSDKINHLLLPSVGRLVNYSLEDEVNLFEQFKIKANLYVARVHTDFEWLAMAQHHGLPTRLLDWTSNPLVATYFAIQSTTSHSDGRVYACSTENSFVDLSKESSPFEVKHIQFLMPPVSTRRIELQRGLFSIHSLPDKPAITTGAYAGLVQIEKMGDSPPTTKLSHLRRDPIAYQHEYYSSNNDLKFDIPYEAKSFFEETIRSLGIDEMLYGDVDSISRLLLSQRTKKQLHRVGTPKHSFAYSLWNENLANEALQYFINNPSEFLPNSSSITSPGKINIYIESHVELHPNIIELHGTISFFIEPNLCNVLSLFVDHSNSNFQSIVKRYSDFLESCNSPIRVAHQSHVSIKFTAQIFYAGSYSDVGLRKLHLQPDKKTTDYLTYIINRYSTFKSWLEKLSNIERSIIETEDPKSEKYLQLVEQLQS